METLTTFIKLITAIIGLSLALMELNHRVTGAGPSPVDFVRELAEDIDTSSSEGPSDDEVDEMFEQSREALEREKERAFDLDPPTAPGNLRVESQNGCAITVRWDASTDDEGIEFYEVFIDGRPPPEVVFAPTTQLLIQLSDGETSNINVVARDTSTNKSPSSAVLQVVC